MKQFHGTRYLSEQVIQNFLAGNVLRRLASVYIPRANESVQDLFQLLHMPSVFRDDIPPTVIGKGDLVFLNETQLRALSDCLGSANCNVAWGFCKSAIRGTLYCTKSYAKDFKRDNSVVLLKGGTICEISMIIKFHPQCTCRFQENGQCLLPRNSCDTEDLQIIFLGETIPVRSKMLYDEFADINLLNFIKMRNCRESQSNIAFRHSDINCKCVRIPDDNNEYFVAHNLQFERS